MNPLRDDLPRSTPADALYASPTRGTPPPGTIGHAGPHGRSQDGWDEDGSVPCPYHGCPIRIRRQRNDALGSSRWLHGGGEQLLQLTDREMIRCGRSSGNRALFLARWAWRLHRYQRHDRKEPAHAATPR